MNRNKILKESKNLKTTQGRGVASTVLLCVFLYWLSKLKKPFNAFNSKVPHSFYFFYSLRFIRTHIYIVWLIFVWTSVFSPGSVEAFGLPAGQIRAEFHHSDSVPDSVCFEKLSMVGMLPNIANSQEELRMKLAGSFVEFMKPNSFLGCKATKEIANIDTHECSCNANKGGNNSFIHDPSIKGLLIGWPIGILIAVISIYFIFIRPHNI